jgi:DNA-binding response OmpR family regulator
MSDVAMTGAEVVERAAMVHYAAILIDLELPDSDGISVIQKLREQPQNNDIPIIVVSSDPARGRDDTRSVALDIIDWFQKPVDIIRLADAIDRAVGRRADSHARGSDAGGTIKERETA